MTATSPASNPGANSNHGDSGTSGSLRALFNPRSVAVIGASRTPGKLGHTVLANLVRGGYAGAIMAINPGGEAVLGQPGYRSVADVPGPVDCAFLAIPAGAIEDAVRACAAKGVRAAIIGAAGFAELGDAAGRARQDSITAIARAAGMRLLGPNTNGILALGAKLQLGYNASHGEAFPAGPVSIVSHSGALFDGVARRLRDAGAGLANFVPVGNEADLGMLEVLDWLIADPATRVIGLVIEGLSDGAGFLARCRAAHAAGKHMVALKIGRSQRGASAALAHSARLAGSARAWEALFAAGGVASVASVEALAGACALLTGIDRATVRAHADQRLVCITSSGAGGAILADYASAAGFMLAGHADGTWPDPAGAAIGALPTMAPIRNPVDTGSRGDWSLLEPTFAAIEADGFRGPTVVYAHQAAATVMTEALIHALIGRRRRIAAPLAVLAPGGLGAEVEARYLAAGIPVFYDTASCFDSLAACRPLFPDNNAPARAKTVGRNKRSALRRMEASHHPDPDQFNSLNDLAPDAAVMNELDSAAVLRAAGVPMVAARVLRNDVDARAAAAALGYPLVLKALAPGIAHKNAAGLVHTRIADEAQLLATCAALRAHVLASGHDPAATPLVLQPMQSAEAELIVGVAHEPGLGHFLVVGLGGIHTELFDQVGLLHIATPAAALRERLAASLTGRLLATIDRTTAPAPSLCDQVGAVLLALQGLIRDHGARIESIDINPLLVGKTTCCAVDALIVRRAPAAH